MMSYFHDSLDLNRLKKTTFYSSYSNEVAIFTQCKNDFSQTLPIIYRQHFAKEFITFTECERFDNALCIIGT